MPYKQDLMGVYKIVNTVTQQCYVGQSVRMQKRIKEHFRLLRWGKHSNPHLQKAYNKYGPEAFVGSIEVVCSSPEEMDALENAFIQGEAAFDQPVVYNIADWAKAPMRGNSHSEAVREKIRLGRRASTFDFRSAEYRKTLSDAQRARTLADPKLVAKIRFIVENPNMSYAERARQLKAQGFNADTGSVRKLALKYRHLKGAL